MTAFIGVAIILVALVGAVWFGAHRNRKAFARLNEIVPGVPSRAPGAWAGAHSPEALLHRRLIAAVAAARAQLGPGSSVDDAVAAIQSGALQTDDQLIAAAALPASQREAAIRAVEPSVAALEEAAGRLASARAASSTAVNDAVTEAEQRVTALGDARAELERAENPPSITDLLSEAQDARPAAQPSATPPAQNQSQPPQG